MKKLNDYIKSLPVRLVAAVIVLVTMYAIGKFDHKEEPAAPPQGQQTGILDAYRESTENTIRIMATQPPDR